MREHCLGSYGVTSRDEAMGTNGDVFPVQRLRSELEILDDIWSDAEALRQRLEHRSTKISASWELRTYTRIGHVVETRIATLDVRYGTSRRQRTGDGSGRRLGRRKGLGRDRLWRGLEHWMEVRIVTWGRLHGRGRGVGGATWARIIGWHRGIARGNHVGPGRNIRISFGRRAAT
jgi:hypothetical protein